jgi:hypothetical protein
MATEKQRLIFISYSRTNRGFALELAKELKASGFRIWFDQLDIPTGARWDDEIEKALVECEIFMVILTPQSISSNNVKDEVGYAIDSNKRILPILLENANVPFRLRRFQYVDFTNKSNNEGIDAAKQLLRKLMDEPTQPPPAPISVEVQSTQPEVDHSAELKADANRLARQRAEAVRKAREREQIERTTQAIPQAPSPAIRPAQPTAQKPASSKLIPMIAGIGLALLLCLGGGAIAWRIIFPPLTPVRPPDTITAIPPTEVTPPTPVPSTTEAPPVGVPTTPAPPPVAIPSDPSDFIRFYFDNINNRNYELTWSLLSDQYKAKVNSGGQTPYVDFWNSVLNSKGKVNISSVEYTYITGNTSAVVSIASNIQAKPLNYYLIRDNTKNTWLFEPLPEFLDVTCSNAPKSLNPGRSAVVATNSDNLLLRSAPTDGATIEAMQPGTIVDVLEGPLCNYYSSESVFFWWWKVRSPSGNQGWVVEGRDSSDPVFIQPWP